MILKDAKIAGLETQHRECKVKSDRLENQFLLLTQSTLKEYGDRLNKAESGNPFKRNH